MNLLKRSVQSVLFYPVTTVYLAGVLVATAVAGKVVELGIGIATLTAIAVLVVLVGIVREVQIVHSLVNSQRDELLLRISDLVDALKVAGVALPAREAKAEKGES